MQVKPLTLKNVHIKNNIFLAPIAGFTDYAVRKLELSLGIGLTFTELVSAKGAIYKAKGTTELLYNKGNENETSAQIFGSDPYVMREAIESDYFNNYKMIDINMGCPVPKVFNNGEGSALLKDIHKASDIIKECVKTGKIITIKIRTGQVKGDDIARDFAMMAEDSGASLVTIHGRVRESYYSGEPDYDAIYKAKKSVNIPIIANGGIFTTLDADKMMDNTGADGIMLARGALADPFLICKLLQTEPAITLKEFITKYFEIMNTIRDDKVNALEFRKFTSYLFKGMNHGKDLRMKIMTCNTTQEIVDIIKENL